FPRAGAGRALAPGGRGVAAQLLGAVGIGPLGLQHRAHAQLLAGGLLPAAAVDADLGAGGAASAAKAKIAGTSRRSGVIATSSGGAATLACSHPKTTRNKGRTGLLA